MSLQIPIFVGVNDNPLPPNEINNANADYFIERFNSLVKNTLESDEILDEQIINVSLNGDINSLSILELIESSIQLEYSQLTLDLSGSFSDLDLSRINYKKLKLISTNGSTISGSRLFKFSPRCNNVEIDSNNINLLINNDTYIDANSNLTFTINDCSITRTTSLNKKIYIKNCKLIINNLTVNNSNNTQDFIITNNVNLIINNNTISINSTVDFRLFSTDNISTILVNRNNSIISTPITKLINSNYSLILISDLFPYDNIAELNKLASGNYYLFSTSQITNAKIIRDSLETLSSNDRLDASAIKNLTTISGEEIRDNLQSLSGTNRLSASAIKDLNNINFFTSTTAEFSQPAINSNVTIFVGDSSFLGVGNYILIGDAGVYLVQSVISQTSISIKNLGYSSNVEPGTQIINGKLITLTGKNGQSSIAFTTSNFVLPTINSSIDIQVDNSEIFSIGTIILVNNVDYFRITSINSSTNVLSTVRLGYYTLVNSGTTISSNTKVSIGGLKGERGINSFTYTSSDFIQPGIFEDVSIDVDITDFLLPGIVIFIENGGFYKVESIDDINTITIKNLGYTSNISPTSTINDGSKLIIAGEQGLSSYTYTTLEFTAPGLNNNVDIQVQNVEFLSNDIFIKVSTGIFKIISINSSTNTITAQHVNYSPLPPTTVVPELSKLIIIGERGPQGIQGESGLNCFTNFQQFTMPAINGTIVLIVDNSLIFVEGLNIFVQGAGIFEVVSILDSTSLTIRNIGVFGNTTPSTTINSGKVFFVGKSFNGYYGEFSGTFTMPAINSTTTLDSIISPDWLNINDYLYIPTIGIVLVTNISGNTITIKNEYISTNSIPTTSYNNGRYYLILGGINNDNVVLRTSSDYIQPNVGNNISVSAYTTKWLTPGMIISGPNSGHYEVITITNSTTVLLKNLGYGFNNQVSPGTTITQDTNFIQVGARGPIGYNPTYSLLQSNFTQPAINSNVQVTLNDTSWIVAGQGLAIQGGGPNYTVVSVDSITNITVKNNGYENVSPTTLIVGNGTQIVTPSGIRGKDSSTAIITSANFTQPAINSNVLISVDRTDNINVGSIISGPNSGYYEVITKNSASTVTIKNLNYPTLNTKSPGTNVLSGEVLTITGPIGPTSFNATYSLLQSNFTQPAINSNVQVTLNDTSWISVGQFLFIFGGGDYEVVSVDSGTLITIKNLGNENTLAGSIITGSGTQKVSPSGRRGLNGSISTATFATFTHQLINPSLTLNSVNLFSKTDNSLYTIDSTGTEHKLNQDLVIGNSLNNILNISNNSGTNGLNLGSSNTIYGTNSTINIGSNGTIPGSLVLADELNTKKITIKSPTNANLTTSYTLELPNNAGSNGFALTTNGLGKTSWTQILGGAIGTITDGTTSVSNATTLNFIGGAIVTQNGNTANITVSGGTLDSITDGTTTINNATSINFTKGAIITQNGSLAEIEVKGGGLEAIYTNSATYDALINTLIIVGPDTTTINLPLNPENGSKISICDYSERFDVSPITISSPIGNTIYSSNTLVLDTKYATVQLVYYNTKWVLYGTEIFSDSTGTIVPPNTNSLTSELKNSNFLAVENYLYLVDTSLGPITATLPNNPANGSKIAFSDFGNNFPINNLTILRSGINVIDEETSKIISSSGTIELVYYQNKWTTISLNSSGGDLSTSLQLSFFYS